MQQEFKILPKYVNTDCSYDKLLPNEAVFMKGVESGINANPGLRIGLNNPTGEGQNVETLTPMRSNVAFPGAMAPEGYNKQVGGYESVQTREFYYFNYNSKGNHGIYVLNGDEFKWYKVVEDSNLLFTDNQDNFIAEHRVQLAVVYDKDNNIVEKILTLTEGGSWQKWIEVIAAVGSDGFNDALYPYWKTVQPHYDRRELLEWAVRPPMINPVAVLVPNTPDDTGKVNRIIDQAFQYSSRFGNTDGRQSAFGSFSEPVIIKSEDFNNNPDYLPKNTEITLYAGSSKTEYIDVFVRSTAKKSVVGVTQLTYSTWYWVERLYKFGHDPNVLSTRYWERENPWANYRYDPIFNTIKYKFDNSRLAYIIDNSLSTVLYNDIPIKSWAQAGLNDALGLFNNLYNYDNAPAWLVQRLSFQAQQKIINSCSLPLRKIRLYAYVGRCWDSFNYCSQVGYFTGDDKQMRFGGLGQGLPDSGKASIDLDDSKTFQLDFADKSAFRCYLKGTPFYTDGKWFQVNADNTYVEVNGLLDITQNDVLTYIQNVFNASGYFMCVFDFLVPAGRYTAAIGRHSVASSGDYRNQSTYVYGIADSRIKTKTEALTSLYPNSIKSFSKEFEVDCLANDFDPWGNGHDMFYIYCPYITHQGNKKFAFIEGYLRESIDEPIGVELFPYGLNRAVDDWGRFTDKNGFYWAYTKINNVGAADVDFIAKFNCAYPTTLHTEANQDGSGWKPNNINYLTTYNAGVVGAANRILIYGRITSLDGSIGYSNIGVSIKDGATVYTDSKGNFTLIAHNGQNTPRISNIYVNAGGNFRIFIDNCGPVPLFSFNELLVNCSLTPSGSNPCLGGLPIAARVYPICITLKVNTEGGTQTSLKENSNYSGGFSGADLAGRIMSVNPVNTVAIKSFLESGKVTATYLQMLIAGALEFNKFNPDIKWIAPYVSPKINILAFLDWIGDKAVYIDSNGVVVSDPASAAFVSITLDSLYNYNSANNFSILASWQFTAQDRLRILDDGDGNLFDVATYGSPIDLQILGTNYNQAAVAAGILPNTTTTPVVNVSTATAANNKSVTIYVKYDAVLDKIINKTGFWIEMYTPALQTEDIPFSEMKWMPLINGEPGIFKGLQNGVPAFDFPKIIDVNYWDTYLFSRNISIPTVGNKFFNHVFQSENISDGWGYHLTSGGRQNLRNDSAKQIWKNNATKSNSFLAYGSLNGLGTFQGGANVTDYGNNSYGRIMAVIFQRSIGAVLCENDWFTVNYDFHYAFPNEQGVIIVNPDTGLTRPNPKIGDNFGLSADDTGSVVFIDKYIFWYDRKNEAYILNDYRSARDVSDMQDKDGRSYGINSWLAEKTDFISRWNATHKDNSRFDVIGGVDIRTNRVYFTFRPRRINSNDPTSFVNMRRNLDIKHQETFCFDYDQMRWIASTPWTPEGYGKLRGRKSGVEMLTFAGGKPYYHLNTPNDNFLNFYGVQTEASIILSLSDNPESVKIIQGIAQDILPEALRSDLIYNNEENSYSFLPSNYIVKKENVFYGSLLRDMTSYLQDSDTQAFRSTLHDGKRIFGRYVIARFVSRPGKSSEYFQLSNLFYLATDSDSNKK